MFKICFANWQHYAIEGRINLDCYISAVVPVGVNLQGHNSDHVAVDVVWSGERTIARECQSLVGTGSLRPTAPSRRRNDETAVQPELVAEKLESQMSERRTDEQSMCNVATISSLDLSGSVKPAVITSSSLVRPSHQSSFQCPVKLNGIFNTDKSTDTCSGTTNHCSHSLYAQSCS